MGRFQMELHGVVRTNMHKNLFDTNTMQKALSSFLGSSSARGIYNACRMAKACLLDQQLQPDPAYTTT
jgi:hypothetical protein